MGLAYAAKSGWVPNSLYIYGGAVPGESEDSFGRSQRTHEFTNVGEAWVTRDNHVGATAYVFCGAFQLDDTFFVVAGGFSGSGEGLSSETYRFQPNDHSWLSESGTLPNGARSMSSAFTIGSFGYLTGGHSLSAGDFTDIAETLKYTEGTSTWATVVGGDLPAAITSAAVAVSGSTAWLFGGRTNAGTYTDETDAGTKRTEVYSFDGSTWAAGGPYTPLSLATHAFAAAEVDGKIYLCGGGTGSGFEDDIDEYDTATDTWTNKLPTASVEGLHPARDYGSARTILGKVLITCGRKGMGAHDATNDHREYDPVTNTLRLLSAMPNPVRFGVASGTV